MYDIAGRVRGWLAEGRPVTVARVVALRGIASKQRGQACAATPGEAPAGQLLGGLLDTEVATLLAADAAPRLVEVPVDDELAAAAGYSCGGAVTLLIQPAGQLPAPLWAALAGREPVCLITTVDGDHPGATELFTRDVPDPDAARLFARGVSEASLAGDAAISTYWPTPRLVIVGDGQIADALTAAAALLGWQVVEQADGLSAADGLVVLSHDLQVAGPALATALAAGVGYVGALGSRRTQAVRAEWLAAHGIADVSRVHGPAGLDIGAYTPAEIAVAIVAQMLAVRSGRPGGHLGT